MYIMYVNHVSNGRDVKSINKVTSKIRDEVKMNGTQNLAKCPECNENYGVIYEVINIPEGVKCLYECCNINCQHNWTEVLE